MEENDGVVNTPLLTQPAKIETTLRKKETASLSYVQIFRYSTCMELSATIFGATLALLSGGGIALCHIQIGELFTAFVERTSYTDKLSSYLPMTAAFGGGRRLINASYEERMAALREDATAIGTALVLINIICIILCIWSVSLINWSALHQITRIRILFLKSVLNQDMAWYDTDSEFNLASKMSENLTSLKEGLGEKLTVVANLIGTCLFSVFTSIPLGWELTLACLSVMPFCVATSVVLSNYQTMSSVREMDSYSQAGKHAEETLKSIRTIVAFSGEENEVSRYTRLLQPAERQGRKRGFYTGLGTGFSWILTYFLNTIGLTYGTRLVINDFYKPSEERRYPVGLVFTIMYNVYMAIQSITLCVPHLEVFASARGAAASIFSILEREPVINKSVPGSTPAKRVKGEITLENVHFSYPSRPDVKVLKGFSLHVKAGENVALVGSSGCGKSTVLQLLQRLYDSHSGSVKIDGNDVKKLNLGWLRSSLGVVGQEPVLFRGTVFENIAIGFPEATIVDVQKVAEMAFAHDFIKNLPDGYDTVIGERGASLSGGQKQRIAIARSLLREPAVLLLDEATSALDPHSERQVQAALDRASARTTTITVSHRLSTIRNADRIICMDRGIILEQGTHDELMKKKGFYHKLMTSSKEEKELDVSENLVEMLTDEDNIGKRQTRHHKAAKKACIDSNPSSWISPRGSICSFASIGIQTYAFGADGELEEDKEDSQAVKSVNDWDLLKLNSPEWPLLVLGSFAAIIQGACFPCFAMLLGYSLGMFVLADTNEIISLADLYSVMFIIVAAVAGVSMCIQSFTFTSAGLKMTTRLRRQYFSALLRQEIGYFDKVSNTVGAMCARLSGDTAEIQSATGLKIGIILQGISSVLIGFILAMYYDWKLTLVATSFLPVMVGSVWVEGMVSHKAQAHEREAMESATAIATEGVMSIKTVQSLGIETIFVKKFEDALMDAYEAVARKTRWRGIVLSLSIYMPFIAYSSVAVYGAFLVAFGEIEYKVVTLVNEAIMYGAYMLGQSLTYAPSFNSAKTCGQRILSVIKRQPKVKTNEGILDKDWFATGKFNIKDVEFSYPTQPEQKILKGINLEAEAGKTIALVGSSGSGKSTVLQLIQRFYDPDFGTIELDGQDIERAITLPRLRRQLGVVQQEPVLFDRTIAENIAYGDNTRKISMQDIIEAAKSANIHSFITSLPQGYDTNLGSSGAQLSGGQKQRVCIARALIRSPRLLLLDEATSALDANSERVVAEALEKAAEGRTCITIAHRLSTIQDADLICVVDKGKIVERGSHAELINRKGHYYSLWKGQHKVI